MPKLDSMNNLSPEENKKARETCKEYKALTQASTRAFTSKFKAGTLPLQAYLQPDPGNEIESDTDVDKNTASSDDEETSHASVTMLMNHLSGIVAAHQIRTYMKILWRAM